MTLTVEAAFAGLAKNLEITPNDEKTALRRRQDIFERLCKDLDITGMVKSGSFHRDTKTKPLKDVDFLAICRDTSANRRTYRDADPKIVIAAVQISLEKRYPGKVSAGRRSVRVWFGSDFEEPILSYDVVPAFLRKDGAYDIPDMDLKEWIATDPTVHADLATAANTAADGKWKPVVKMVKGWNRQREEDLGHKPVKPSFLIEVMGLELICPPIGGYADELQVIFETLADAVLNDWMDPAGFGPSVNEMTRQERLVARQELQAAGRVAQEARRLARTSDRQAILKWRELFGPLLPLEADR